MTPTGPVPGTRDIDGAAMAATRRVRASLEGLFDDGGFAFVHPPVLAEPGPFLARSGEAIRQRMYIFQDPGGREICLRPELTIPTARLYLERLAAKSETPARLAYIGPVFRYTSESGGDTPLREYVQAGAEWIGDVDAPETDARILAFALRAADAAGAIGATIVAGDLGLAAEAVRTVPVAPRIRARLLRQLWRPDAFLAALDATRTPRDRAGEANADSRLAEMGAESSRTLIEEILALVNVRHVGARTADEIAERLATKAEVASDDAVSAEIAAELRAWNEIRGDGASVLAAARTWMRNFRSDDGLRAIERAESRLAALATSGVDVGRVTWDLGLRGELEYYTGLVFEIRARHAGKEIVVGGGGRYDGLLRSLGAARDIPSAGFALTVTHLARIIAEAAK
ncbi:MAG: ATP phosphoribosyltransferase regulatory subunit [Deltaproteobacteria bacterium]|nr:ATP phosphoribosyltransferase regulatory subunit [Deltaproteobacteria bacterium]